VTLVMGSTHIIIIIHRLSSVLYPQANTNVVYWGDRLLALWEGGLPHVIDPVTLQTEGTSRIRGVLGPNEALTVSSP
jgi:carotenoid cleavage dioxygenase-like enzyme